MIVLNKLWGRLEEHGGFCEDISGIKRPLGRPESRCGDNIKINFKETGLKVWTTLIWLRIETSGVFL
jgi:hypothetical protein